MSEPIITLDAFMKEMRLQLDLTEAYVRSVRNANGPERIPDLTVWAWFRFLLNEIAAFSHDVEFRDAAAVFVEMLRHKKLDLPLLHPLSSGSAGNSPSLADRVAKLETETRAMCTGCQRAGYYRDNPSDFSMSPTECNIHGGGNKLDALAVAHERIAYLEGALLGLGAEETVVGGPGGREVG